jgi:SAM-dependent methyltransferase
MVTSSCRFCGAPLEHVFADLGMSPLANSYLPPERANAMEPFYPLCALVCASCYLVQLEDFESPQHIFGEDYAYFSSYSTSWLEHCRRYTEQMVGRFGYDGSSQVVELASNDGYLLQYFKERGVPVLGIEPAGNVAQVAIEKGIPTRVEFFGVDSGGRLAQDAPADLLLGNNVLAHVPDINDFVGGMKLALKPDGVITIEFPHLLKLIERNQWDTIYHEHFSYLSFTTVGRVFEAHGLRLFDVEELPTHGGSLRIYGCHADSAHEQTDAAREMLAREDGAGLNDLSTYLDYGQRVVEDKRRILEFLIALKREGLSIAGYGAPAKGNTLLNFCGVGKDFLSFTCDLNPHKQGQVLPGTHIPIRSPDALREAQPDIVLILPWNLREEITEQLSFIREWGGRFAARAPDLQLFA